MSDKAYENKQPEWKLFLSRLLAHFPNPRQVIWDGNCCQKIPPPLSLFFFFNIPYETYLKGAQSIFMDMLNFKISKINTRKSRAILWSLYKVCLRVLKTSLLNSSWCIESDYIYICVFVYLRGRGWGHQETWRKPSGPWLSVRALARMVWGLDELFQKGLMNRTAKTPIQYLCIRNLTITSCALTSFLPTVHISSGCVAFNLAEQLIKADAGYWMLPHAPWPCSQKRLLWSCPLTSCI